MLPDFMLPGFGRGDGDEYPVWVTPRDTKDIFEARKERASQSAPKDLDINAGGKLPEKVAGGK